MQLSIGLDSTTRAPALGDAVIDIDFPARRYRFGEKVHADRAAFVAHAGGAVSGDAIILGPQLAGPERIADGDFDAGTPDGWASTPAFAGQGAIAVVDNRLVASIASTTGAYRFARANAATPGRAYRFGADLVARGPTPPLNALSINASTNVDLGGSDARFAALGAGSPDPQPLEVVAGTAANTLYTGFVMSAPANVAASATLDHLSLREVLPYTGYQPGGFAFCLRGTTAAALAGNRVALQWGTDGERFRIRLVWDSSGHLRLIVTTNGSEQCNLDLGSAAAQEAFSIEANIGPNRVAARRDAGPVQLDSTVVIPSIGRLWIGRSPTGEAWEGSLQQLRVWPSERLPDGAILLEGDSYVAGAASIGLAPALLSEGVALVSTAQGGSTLADLLARLVAHPGLARNVVVVWDGEMGAGTTAAEHMALYEAIAAQLAHGRFLVLPPCRRANRAPADNAEVTALQSSLALRFPGRIVDAQAILAAAASLPGDAADTAAGTIPSSLLQADLTHLGSSGMTLVANAVLAALTLQGWA